MRKSRSTIAAVFLASTLVAAPVVAARPGLPTIASTLLARMNSGPEGRVTRRVDCTPARSAPLTFDCELQSVRWTQLRVEVAVTPRGLRETWYPLDG